MICTKNIDALRAQGWSKEGLRATVLHTIAAAGRSSDVFVRSAPVPRNVQRFRGGLVFKAHRLCVSLNSRLESNKEEEEGLSPILHARDLFSHLSNFTNAKIDGSGSKPSTFLPIGFSRPTDAKTRSRNPSRCNLAIRGYLAHKKQPPPRTLQ